MLWDKWAMGPDKFATWTDRQIRQICFHKRDKDGHIVPPSESVESTFKEPATPEEELVTLDRLNAMFGGQLKGVEEGKAKIKARMDKDKKNE
jgi:hypothetical protein